MDALALVDLKLDGVKASSQRARLAFFIAVLSACAIGVALYNEHFAWCRRLLDDGRGFTQWPPPSTTATPPVNSVKTPTTVAAAIPARDSASELSKEKRVEIIKNWEDNTNIKFDLLGIRLGSGDLTFFGSIAMLVVSIYLCLCARRANLEVRSLVDDVGQSQEVGLKDYVLAGIRQSLVLTLVAEKHDAFSDIDKTSSPRLLKLIGSVLSLLTYFPAIAIGGIILGDVEFAFFREDVPSRLWVLRNLHAEYLIQFVALDLLAIAMLVFVCYLNRLTNRFHDATGSAVESLATQKLAAGAGH